MSFTDFNKKAGLYRSSFANQYSLINNNSALEYTNKLEYLKQKPSGDTEKIIQNAKKF